PFGSGTPEALLYRVVHGRPVTDRIPGQLRPIIEDCLAKDPQQRPTTRELLIACGDLARSRAQRTLTERAFQNLENASPTASLTTNGFSKAPLHSWNVMRKRLAGRRWVLAACAA